MNLLKKFILLTGSIFITTSSIATVVACGPRKASLTVLLVPSRNPGELNKTTPILGRLLTEQLAKQGYSENVRVTTATDYDMAARSLASGTAGVAYLPTLNYYQSSIRTKRNSMHQLFQASRTGIRVEYKIAHENLEEMNRSGTLSSIADDEQNIFNIVKNNGPILNREDIETKPEEGIAATYYRGYQYITKRTLFDYYQNGRRSSDLELQQA
jgi:ABC-type metal ion transport system substrate-binding protein